MTAVWTTSGLFLVSLLLLTPLFIINDDLWLLFIAKGVGISLHPDPHLFFNNALLGHLLNTAFQLFPRWNWYASLLVAVQFASATALLYSLLLQGGGKRTLYLSILGFLLLNIHFLARLNYTIAAILAFIAGLFLWASSGNRRIHLWAGAVFLTLSFLIRQDAFFFSAVLSAPFLLTLLKTPTERRKIFGALTLTAAFLLVSFGLNEYHYQNDPSWRAFHHDYRQLADLQANQTLIDPQITPQTFKEAGWTLNDYNLFHSWYFLDDDTYGPQSIKKVAPAFHHYHPNGLQVFSDCFRDPFAFYALVFLAVLFFLLTGRHRRTYLLHLAWFATLLVALAFFSRLPERLYLPTLALSIQLGLWFGCLDRAGSPDELLPEGHSTLRTVLLALLLPLFLVPFNLRSHWSLGREDRETALELKRSVIGLHPKDNQLYVLWDSHFPYELWRAFDDFEAFRDFHILALAPFQRSPLQKEMLARFGVKNLFRDMVDRPDIFLICYPSDGLLYMQYLKERFGLRARAKKTYVGCYFLVYQIESDPPLKSNVRPSHP
jgi:hypothetical protein